MGLLRVISAQVDQMRVMRGLTAACRGAIIGAILALSIVPLQAGVGASRQQAQAQGNHATAPCCVQPSQVQPYTAEFKITRVQTLADGTTITHETKRVKVSDSQGRTLVSTTESPFGSEQPALTYVTVRDPVEGTQTNWDSRSRRATIVKLPPLDQRHGCWHSDLGRLTIDYGPAPTRAKVQPGGGVGTGSLAHGTPAWRPVLPRFTREDLGTTTIMGVEVRGNRLTQTTPAGAIGNDRPLVTTTDTWVAPNLGIALREVQDNPQMGKTTTEVQSLDLSQPVMATFQPPEGYAVVTDEMRQVPCQNGPR